MRKAVISGVLALTLGPAVFLLALGALLNPAAQASCLPTTSGAFSNVGDATPPIPETSHVVMPLPAGTWVKTSGFGIRVHPVTGETKLHTGVDFAAPTGTHILAAADGRVVFAGAASGYGNLILIEHNVGGRTVATGYAHMYANGIHVTVGQSVTAGEYIADVGVAGYSTGPHLHFEVRPGGADGAPIDPEPWLASHGAVDIEAGSNPPPRDAQPLVARHRRSTATTRETSSTTRRPTARSPSEPPTSSRRSEPTSRRVRGPVGPIVPDMTTSMSWAGRATERSAMPSARPRAAKPSTTAGRSPTG